MTRPVTARRYPTPIHVEERGAGPCVLFLHGFAGTARNFRPELRALADRARAVAFDARGHGRSGAPEEPGAYAPDEFVADIGDVLERLGVERAVLVGISMGAGLALRFALAQPERVRALVVASFPKSGGEARDWAFAFAAAIESRGVTEAGVEFVIGQRARFDPEGARLLQRGLAEHRPAALAAVLRQLLASQPSVASLADELRGLTIPTLVVAGEADVAALPPSRRLAELLPEARLEIVAGAGHVVNLEQPRAFQSLLDRFLAELPSDGP